MDNSTYALSKISKFINIESRLVIAQELNGNGMDVSMGVRLPFGITKLF